MVRKKIKAKVSESVHWYFTIIIKSSKNKNIVVDINKLVLSIEITMHFLIKIAFQH